MVWIVAWLVLNWTMWDARLQGANSTRIRVNTSLFTFFYSIIYISALHAHEDFQSLCIYKKDFQS